MSGDGRKVSSEQAEVASGAIGLEEGGSPSSVKPPVDVLDWLLFVPFAFTFLAILLIFDVLEKVAFRIRGEKGLERVITWLEPALMTSLRLLGTRFQIEGESDVPGDEPVIIVSNHQSMFDIPILASVLAKHRPRFVAKKELAKWLPGVSFNLRNGGSAVIDRENASSALREIVKLGKRLTAGKYGVVLFPEGTRARSGELKFFKPAGFSTLVRTAPTARVLPVAIDNSWKLMAYKRGPIPRGVQVKVRVFPSISPAETAAENLLNSCRESIATALQEWRKGSREL